MGNIKETSLDKALKYAKLSELPKMHKDTDTQNSFWIKAIVLVRKYDMSQSYAIAIRSGTGKMRYIADFGTASPISGLIAVFPFLCLDIDKYLPYPTEERRKQALADFVGNTDEMAERISRLSDSEISKYLLVIAVQQQVNDERNIAYSTEQMQDVINDIRNSGEEAEDKTQDDDGIPTVNTIEQAKRDAINAAKESAGQIKPTKRKSTPRKIVKKTR